MVAPVVRPLGVSVVSASILVLIEQAFLGALPTLALAATFVGPFIPLATGAWSRRKVLSAADTQYVFEPLYDEIFKNKDSILGSETYSNIPMFQLNTLDEIRRGARYSLLKDRVSEVEAFRASIEAAFTGQADAKRAATRIIRETIGAELGENGTTVAFRGRNKDGGSSSFEGDMWVTPILIRGRDPRLILGAHMEVESMAIMDRDNSPTATLTFPKDEAKYRRFWQAVEAKAKEDRDIRKCRDALDRLLALADKAQSQVIKEIRKSRGIF